MKIVHQHPTSDKRTCSHLKFFTKIFLGCWSSLALHLPATPFRCCVMLFQHLLRLHLWSRLLARFSFGSFFPHDISPSSGNFGSWGNGSPSVLSLEVLVKTCASLEDLAVRYSSGCLWGAQFFKVGWWFLRANSHSEVGFCAAIARPCVSERLGIVSKLTAELIW